MTALAVRWDGADAFDWRDGDAVRQGDAAALARAAVAAGLLEGRDRTVARGS